MRLFNFSHKLSAGAASLLGGFQRDARFRLLLAVVARTGRKAIDL